MQISNKIPLRFVDIGPHRYRIIESAAAFKKVEEEEGQSLWGLLDPSEFIIYISPGLPASQQKETLLHEIGHIIYERLTFGLISGPDKEEVLVNGFAYGYASVFEQNPRLVRWLAT